MKLSLFHVARSKRSEMDYKGYLKFCEVKKLDEIDLIIKLRAQIIADACSTDETMIFRRRKKGR